MKKEGKSNGRSQIDSCLNEGPYGEKQRALAKEEIKRLALEDKWQKVCAFKTDGRPQDLIYCAVPLPEGTVVDGVKIRKGWVAIGCFYQGFFYAPLYRDSKGRMLRLRESEIEGWNPLFDKDRYSRAFMARLQIRRQEIIDEHYKKKEK